MPKMLIVNKELNHDHEEMKLRAAKWLVYHHTARN